MADGCSEIEKDEIRKALEHGTLSSAVEKIKDYCKQVDSVQLNIAITGESGSGKSTFVNAFRGLDDDDKGAAPTGVVETTMKPGKYPHPKYCNVTVWDLPGIGTPNFKADKYLKDVKFQRYDFFIIIASERFKANDVLLANEIQRTDKKFYFVRSKIDNDLNSEKRKKKKSFDEEKTLELIKKDCVTGLQENGVASPMVFLISSYDLQLYDFPKLEDIMQEELPKHKRNVLLLSLPNIRQDINQRKKEALKADIWKIATLSTAASVLPLPGVSLLADLLLLVKELTRYYQAFDLDDSSLQSLSDKTNVPLRELKAVLKSPLHKGITTDVVTQLMHKFAGEGQVMQRYWLSWIPLLGAKVNMDSWSTTYALLTTCLDELAEDALNVLKKAFPIE